MGRILDVPGPWATGVVDMDWYFRLTIFNQTLHIILGFAYLFAMGRFLWIPTGFRKSGLVTKLTRRIKIAIAFCSVMQAADLLAFYWPRSVACTSISVISALCAATVIIKLPEILDALSTELVLGRIGHESLDMQAKTVGTMIADTDRYERLKARVHMLEDDFQRSGWIAQSRHAMNQLTDLLADLEGILGKPEEDIGEPTARSRRAPRELE